MAIGTELILELDIETVHRIAGEDVQPKEDHEDEWEYLADLVMTANSKVETELQQAHLALARERFDSDAWLGQAPNTPGARYIVTETPEGKRELSPFAISTFGDEDNPHEYMGISIYSRYFPTWLDWRYEYGGSGTSIKFDAESMEMIDEARSAIGEIIPEVLDAEIVIVQQFY